MPFADLFKKIEDLQRSIDELKAERLSQAGDKLISPAETCKLFQPSISLVTLSKWQADGRLKMYRIGGRTWYKASEVLDAGNSLKKYKKA